MSPKEIVNHLHESGYKALIEEEDEEATSVTSGVGGMPFFIRFSRAVPFDGNIDEFEDITFLAMAKAEESIAASKINEVNGNNRFVRVYKDEDTIFFDMDIAMDSRTMTSAAFDNILAAWAAWLPEAVRETLG